MSTGLIDFDCLTNKKDFYYDLDIMKLAAYYRTKREITKLLLDTKEYTQYTRTYFIKNHFDYKIFNKLFKDTRIIYRGYAFAPEGYDPLPEDIEKVQPDTSVYHTYLHFNDILPNRRVPKLHAMETICHARLSTDGEQCNTSLDSIIYKESDSVCLHDFNIFALVGWKNILDQLKDKTIRARFAPITDNIEDIKYVLNNYQIISENHFILSGNLVSEQLQEIISLGTTQKDKIKISFFKDLDITNPQNLHDCLLYAMNTILELKQKHLRVHAYIDQHDINEKSVILNNVAYWSNRNHSDISFSTWIHEIRNRGVLQFDTMAKNDVVFNYLYTVRPSQWEKVL